jgi:hypothetical protein
MAGIVCESAFTLTVVFPMSVATQPDAARARENTDAPGVDDPHLRSLCFESAFTQTPSTPIAERDPMHPQHRSKNRLAKMIRPSVLARACGTAAATLGLAASAQAIDFGPFSLTGFAKVDVTRVSSECLPKKCQVEQFAGKEFVWSDELVQGVGYGNGTTHVTLFQPYLGVKFDLPRGFKLSGLLSQRWRDGKEDFKDFWYEKNVAIGHEDYGRLGIGAMTTRSWSIADYPFGSDIGVGDPWSSSGAG